jgi:hypothetical protein
MADQMDEADIDRERLRLAKTLCTVVDDSGVVLPIAVEALVATIAMTMSSSGLSIGQINKVAKDVPGAIMRVARACRGTPLPPGLNQ